MSIFEFASINYLFTFMFYILVHSFLIFLKIWLIYLILNMNNKKKNNRERLVLLMYLIDCFILILAPSVLHTRAPVTVPVLKVTSASGFNTWIGIFSTYLMTSLVYWPLNKDSVMSVN